LREPPRKGTHSPKNLRPVAADVRAPAETLKKEAVLFRSMFHEGLVSKPTVGLPKG
jgi:hypothetical protein